jgi:hypothetical protein
MIRIAALAANLASAATLYAGTVPFMPCCFNFHTGGDLQMPCCFVGNLLMLCCQRFF